MAQCKNFKNIPKTERISTRIRNEEEILTHIITEKITGMSKEYLMYKVEDNKTYTLLGKSNNPLKLEEKFIENKEI
jgi:hypothetical protein